MSDIRFCSPEAGDIPALKALWRRVFGDSGAIIDSFFQAFFDPRLTVVAKGGEDVAAMAYVIPAGEYTSPGESFSAAMIYAVACAPEYEGRGYGTAVTERACALAGRAGFESVILHPANEGLFRFYERMGFATGFYVNRAAVQPADSGDIALRDLTVGEYALLRERLIGDRPHIRMDIRALEYQQRLCALCGGGMVAVDLHGQDAGCLIYEGQGGELTVKEYLCPLPPERVAGLISRGVVDFRLYAGEGGGARPFAMYRGRPCGGYCSLVFD
ncbi:MAG: GNAT family N-acetyltransferase [Oscillospiraceae bacterium]|nr:GNAT family N-acetyltransferase [Oscillospiraceae bacterium]